MESSLSKSGKQLANLKSSKSGFLSIDMNAVRVDLQVLQNELLLHLVRLLQFEFSAQCHEVKEIDPGITA